MLRPCSSRKFLQGVRPRVWVRAKHVVYTREQSALRLEQILIVFPHAQTFAHKRCNKNKNLPPGPCRVSSSRGRKEKKMKGRSAASWAPFPQSAVGKAYSASAGLLTLQDCLSRIFLVPIRTEYHLEKVVRPAMQRLGESGCGGSSCSLLARLSPRPTVSLPHTCRDSRQQRMTRLSHFQYQSESSANRAFLRERGSPVRQSGAKSILTVDLPLSA
ncbi:hypothetical protein BKA67DRAFT_650332 [Truncatella angustata]|uniref:Uncharacterized protein n=1 Tax=Truncatella angustata TaxID=152316 RepID=A0A9P8UCA4_9PEZI|nr:uncharacterized protein BKA67DRAFT_650332 [Truncatella angustata]KAH6647162.1 hypothetical protein BKA67DRAFT_650332 [Truncatella angustata]